MLSDKHPPYQPRHLEEREPATLDPGPGRLTENASMGLNECCCNLTTGGRMHATGQAKSNSIVKTQVAGYCGAE